LHQLDEAPSRREIASENITPEPPHSLKQIEWRIAQQASIKHFVIKRTGELVPKRSCP